MSLDNADARLGELLDDPEFRHRDAALRAVRFRASGDVAELVGIHDDPHECGMIDLIFLMAGSARPWLNWVPMPTEVSCTGANEIGKRSQTRRWSAPIGEGRPRSAAGGDVTSPIRVAGVGRPPLSTSHKPA